MGQRERERGGKAKRQKGRRVIESSDRGCSQEKLPCLQFSHCLALLSLHPFSVSAGIQIQLVAQLFPGMGRRRETRGERGEGNRKGIEVAVYTTESSAIKYHTTTVYMSCSCTAVTNSLLQSVLVFLFLLLQTLLCEERGEN